MLPLAIEDGLTKYNQELETRIEIITKIESISKFQGTWLLFMRNEKTPSPRPLSF